MEIAFIVTWFVAAAAHLYASCYWLPMWATGFRKKQKHQGYMRRALTGYGVFLAAILVGFIEGGVAELWGGVWH